MFPALRQHWPEYLIEAWALGMFMISAVLFTALLEHPSSPVHQFIPAAFARRALIGLAMGLTAVALIYSPWGQRSGAHMNPATTLTFLRLGKVMPWDAAFYILAQFVGGVCGVLLSKLLLGAIITHPSVSYVTTVPGPAGVGIAFMAEAAIACGMMFMVLFATNTPKLARFTGLFASALVFLYITFEAPLSGMSINPARTFASALPSGIWTSGWIYFTAPVLGMLLAAQFFLLFNNTSPRACPKLHHGNQQRCIFCGHCGDANIPVPPRSRITSAPILPSEPRQAAAPFHRASTRSMSAATASRADCRSPLRMSNSS
jgi:aquaporin Z